MNKPLATLLSALLSATVVGSALFCAAANAQDATDAQSNDSALSSDWSFGLQAAPLVFGISLRHHLNDDWQIQGVLSPHEDDTTVALRVLRTSTQKKYWQSYLFSGLALGKDTEYVYDNVNFTDSDQKYTATVFTAGLGVEWSWAAKNPSLPPLSWSVELGLGYSDKNFENSDISGNSRTFLAAGAGIHYQFE